MTVIYGGLCVFMFSVYRMKAGLSIKTYAQQAHLFICSWLEPMEKS